MYWLSKLTVAGSAVQSFSVTMVSLVSMMPPAVDLVHSMTSKLMTLALGVDARSSRTRARAGAAVAMRAAKAVVIWRGRWRLAWWTAGGWSDDEGITLDRSCIVNYYELDLVCVRLLFSSLCCFFPFLVLV